MTPEEVRQLIRDEFFNILKIDRFVIPKNLQILDARNIQLGRGTGTKIGTASDQKLGFYGLTPVDQPATVSDAATQGLTGTDTINKTKLQADLTSCKTATNAIISRLKELGLIA